MEKTTTYIHSSDKWLPLWLMAVQLLYPFIAAMIPPYCMPLIKHDFGRDDERCVLKIAGEIALAFEDAISFVQCRG